MSALPQARPAPKTTATLTRDATAASPATSGLRMNPATRSHIAYAHTDANIVFTVA